MFAHRHHLSRTKGCQGRPSCRTLAHPGPCTAYLDAYYLQFIGLTNSTHPSTHYQPPSISAFSSSVGSISTSGIGSNFDSSKGGKTGSGTPSAARCALAFSNPQ